MARTIKPSKQRDARSSTNRDPGGNQVLRMKKQQRKGRKLNQWSESRMQGAIDEFKSGNSCLRRIARAWDIPKSTLARRIKGDIHGCKHASGKQCVLSVAAEAELCELINSLTCKRISINQKGHPEPRIPVC